MALYLTKPRLRWAVQRSPQKNVTGLFYRSGTPQDTQSTVTAMKAQYNTNTNTVTVLCFTTRCLPQIQPACWHCAPYKFTYYYYYHYYYFITLFYYYYYYYYYKTWTLKDVCSTYCVPVANTSLSYDMHSSAFLNFTNFFSKLTHTSCMSTWQDK